MLNQTIDSSSLSLFRRADGRIVARYRNASNETLETPVQIVCAFPWSHPAEFITLRDDKGKEIVMIEKLATIPVEQRALIEEELKFCYFIPRISKIHAVVPAMEFFHWRVETTAGPRNILTKRHELPRSMPNGVVIIKDISNDLYLIERLEGLDAKSKKMLWVYLD